ncbi:MAG: radical SAM protein [Actinobacteria bacterium]|nr:radical SAM protein [Actinomycetota bacterium]
MGERVLRAGVGLLYHDCARGAALGAARLLTEAFVHAGRRHGTAPRIDRERELFAKAVLATTDRMAARRAASRHFMETSGLLWARALAGADRAGARRRFERVHGFEPPWVLVVAPTGACNLRCPGCYSGESGGGSMAFDELDRLVAEARRLWGIKVLVFSGGEPMLYGSDSKRILDLVARHQDLLCLVFTNGTMIDRDSARRYASLGNVTVALSIEGLAETTDARRGPGSFEEVCRAADMLTDAGAIFGVSMTATSRNCEELLSDELLDRFFADRPAFYGFIFQYMPEGRGPDPSLMPTPAQRLWIWERTWEVIESRRIMLIDFWNHGTLVGGCAAAGRERGYLYVDWDGNVLPCVFAPYSDVSIRDVWDRGGTLSDAWASPFLSEIRGWQRRHVSGGGPGECGEVGGRMLRTCPVRDHYPEFRDMVLRTGARPVGESAGSCLSSPSFASSMADYGRDFAALSRPLLDEEYHSG